MGVGEKCEHIGFFRLQFYALNTSQTGVSVASVCPQYLHKTVIPNLVVRGEKIS